MGNFTLPVDNDQVIVLGIMSALELEAASELSMFLDNRFRAELSCRAHGHGRVHAKLSCFVAARGDNPSVACAPDEDRLAFEAVVKKPLHGHKKGVQIQVYNASLFFHENC